METGKRICQALKKVRKRIADANNIPLETEECTHKGDCPGTCPKCEGELQYLMKSMDKRKEEGKPVVLDGLMSEEALNQAFGVERMEEKQPDLSEVFILEGMPSSPESILLGDIAAPANFTFASAIVKELLAMTDGNIVFSPVGLCRILEMLQEGMDTNSTIYEKVDELTSGCYCNIETSKDDDFTLEYASSVWYNKSLGAIKEEYLDALGSYYKAAAYQVDFSHVAETKRCIDKWVSDNTHSMITKLDADISKDALMVLLDAIYMNGKWKNPFNQDLTETDTFYNADATTSEVDMMFQEIEEAEYYETKEFQVINLPYRHNAYSMVVVLPKEGVSIESIMESTDWLECYTVDCDAELYMPRFKFNSILSFKEILTSLGLGDLFEKEETLPYITDEPAHIRQVKQQCVISVQEEGTEASAITMVECEVGCLPSDDMPKVVTMRLDRPFGFAVKSQMGQLLFMGVMRKME